MKEKLTSRMKNRAHVPTSSVYSTHVMNPRPKSPNAASPTSSYDSSGRLVASCGSSQSHDTDSAPESSAPGSIPLDTCKS